MVLPGVGQLGCPQPAAQLRVQRRGVRRRTLSTRLESLFDAARDCVGRGLGDGDARAPACRSSCATGWPVCSRRFSSDTTFEEQCSWRKKDQWNIGYWIVAVLLLLMLQNYWQAAKTVEPVPYSEFEKALAEGRVAEVLVSDRTVTGRLKSPDSRGKTTIVATRVEPELAERLSKYGVSYARVVESTWLRDMLVVDSAGRGLLRRLVLPVPPLRREAGHGRLPEHRQEPRQGIHGEEHWRDLRRCRWRR